MLTAKKVYKEIVDMPLKEREQLFAIIARYGFEKTSYSHDEVFADLYQSPFTLNEAAEYLEVSPITVRRWLKDGKLSAKKIGRSIVFDVGTLRACKRKLTPRV